MKKRVSAFLLSLAMILALLVPASAAVVEPENPNGGGGIGPVITHHITGDGVYLRTGPGTSYPALGQVYSGEYCDKLGVSGDWTKVKMTSGYNIGKSGYVPSQYVALGY